MERFDDVSVLTSVDESPPPPRVPRKARRAFIDPTGASEPFVYRYEAPGREFRVEVKFKKANISAEELFDALNAAAQNIDEAT